MYNWAVLNAAMWRRRIKFLHPQIYRFTNRTWPTRLQIETTSICNADCNFCPYPVVSKEVPMGHMSQELFEKIVREGKDLRVEYFCLFINNEPFVDPRIVERIAFVRRLGGKPIVSTNASLMTDEKGRQALAAGLHSLVVNMPSADEKEYETIIPKLKYKTVVKNLEDLARYQKEYACGVTVQVNVAPGRPKEGVQKTIEHWKMLGLNVLMRPAMDRAGNVALFSQNIHLKKLRGCAEHHEVGDLHVIFNGDVLLCCQDWRRTVVLGNASRQSLKEIYLGKKYFEIRRQMYGLKEAPENFLCRKCEFGIGRG